jgi:threonyl-tRNA synthetase
VRVVPVAEDFLPYAEKIKAQLDGRLIRAEVDFSNDSFSKKVRNAITRKIPNIWIVGANEMKDETVTWRRYAAEKQIQAPLAKAGEMLEKMVKERLMDNFSDVGLPE